MVRPYFAAKFEVQRKVRRLHALRNDNRMQPGLGQQSPLYLNEAPRIEPHKLRNFVPSKSIKRFHVLHFNYLQHAIAIDLCKGCHMFVRLLRLESLCKRAPRRTLQLRLSKKSSGGHERPLQSPEWLSHTFWNFSFPMADLLLSRVD